MVDVKSDLRRYIASRIDDLTPETDLLLSDATDQELIALNGYGDLLNMQDLIQE